MHRGSSIKSSPQVFCSSFQQRYFSAKCYLLIQRALHRGRIQGRGDPPPLRQALKSSQGFAPHRAGGGVLTTLPRTLRSWGRTPPIPHLRRRLSHGHLGPQLRRHLRHLEPPHHTLTLAPPAVSSRSAPGCDCGYNPG